MNVVLATDNKYVQHCCVTITSILCNNKDVDIYIITEGLSVHNENLLRQQIYKFGGKYHKALVNSELIAKLPMPKDAPKHISTATYYRLFITDILPNYVDKIIYLDCDIVVRGSLEDYWNIDIKGKPIAAVYQYNRWAINVYERLDMDGALGYFNAGSILVNLKYWREFHVKEIFLEYIKSSYDCIFNHDQDVLNACLYKNVVPISNIWNYRFPMPLDYYGNRFIDKKKALEIKKNAIVIHYVHIPKPWEYACHHPYVNEYYKYLDITPFSGWRPVFNFHNILIYRIRPILVCIKHLFDKIFC